MSSCFSLYTPLSPHHNLARYCIQASCPARQEPALHQVRDLNHLDILMVSRPLLSNVSAE